MGWADDVDKQRRALAKGLPSRATQTKPVGDNHRQRAPRRFFTAREDKLVRRAALKGVPAPRVAKRLRRRSSSVYNRLDILFDGNPPRTDAGNTPYTAWERKFARRALRLGYSAAAIARRLGRNEKAFARMVKDHGLKTRP